MSTGLRHCPPLQVQAAPFREGQTNRARHEIIPAGRFNHTVSTTRDISLLQQYSTRRHLSAVWLEYDVFSYELMKIPGAFCQPWTFRNSRKYGLVEVLPTMESA